MGKREVRETRELREGNTAAAAVLSGYFIGLFIYLFGRGVRRPAREGNSVSGVP
jgi:hypothetical protein